MQDHTLDPHPAIDAFTDPALLALEGSQNAFSQNLNSAPLTPSPSAPASRKNSTSSKQRAGLKKRAHTTLSEKVMIINFIKENPSWDQATVAKHFQQQGFPTLSQSTISRYIKDQDRYRSLALDPSKWNVKKQKQAQSPNLAICMDFWFYQTLGLGSHPEIEFDHDLLRQKWSQFESLLTVRHKKRLGALFSFESFRDQAKRFKRPLDPRPTASIDVTAEKNRLRLITDQYDPIDILAMDEIGLAYSCPPSAPVALHSQPKLTLVLTCSADGLWKDSPLLVGETPKAVAYPSDQIGDNCGFTYHWNNKALMTCAIWEKYLTELDDKCRSRGRRVLLLVDRSHVHLLPHPAFQNVRVEFINASPALTTDPYTPACHPFEAGITKYFKSEYRVRFCLRALSSDEFGLSDLYNLDQAAATRIIQDAWNCMMPSAISNAFRHTGIISPRANMNQEKPDELSDEGECVVVRDAAMEQSIASLSMCLTQLTIKVMNLAEQTDDPSPSSPPAFPQEVDMNINPELALLGGPAQITARCRPKKPEEQIVGANEFIEMDSSVCTETCWEDEEIVDQVLRETREASGAGMGWGAMMGPSAGGQGRQPVADVAKIEASFRAFKREVSVLSDYGDIMVDDEHEARRCRARTADFPVNQPSNNMFEQPELARDALRHSASQQQPPPPQQQQQQQQQPHQQHQQRVRYHEQLSSFSQQISNVEALRNFCIELVEKHRQESSEEDEAEYQDEDEGGATGGRLRGISQVGSNSRGSRLKQVVGECLPLLRELEDEFRALEAADLLRCVSG